MFRKILVLLLAISFLAGGVTSVLACTNPPPQPPKATVTNLDGNKVKVTLTGYTTFGAAPGQFCACGLAVLDTLCVKLDSAVVVQKGTQIPVPGFSTFIFNPSTKGSFNAAQSGNWSGFLSTISGSVPPGDSIDLCFFGRKVNCTTAGFIKGIGAASLVGTGEGNPDGTVKNDAHRSIGPFSIRLDNVPSLTFYGMIILALLLAGTAVWLFRRRLAVEKGGVA